MAAGKSFGIACFAVAPGGGVAHGDDTRGGSGSNVKIEAIARLSIAMFLQQYRLWQYPRS